MTQVRDRMWEYLKAFTLFVLLIDHCVHAYGQQFNRWHFIADQGASWVDYFYLYDNTLVTPMLFFLLGICVIPSLQTNQIKSYMKNRFFKYGIPWLVGVAFIVPLLCFPRFLVENPEVSYGDFLIHIYFPERMQGGGPFWILWYAFFLTTLTTILHLYTPVLIWMRTLLIIWARRPYIGTSLAVLFFCSLNYFSDLYFGSYGWIGFVNWMDPPLYAEDASWFYHILKLFKVQGSKFLIQGLFFLMGAAFGNSVLMTDSSLREKWSKAWRPLFLASCLSFMGYALYITSIFESRADAFQDLYSSAYAFLIKEGYEGPRVFEAFQQHMHFSGPRLFLQGLFLILTALAWIAIFQRFFRTSNKIFQAYTPNSYGIFLLHEIPVIWMQYALISTSLPIIVKIMLVFIIGLSSSWGVTSLLRKSMFLRKIV